MKNQQGILCVSLDTELIWGMHDSPNCQAYMDNILNGRNQAIPRMLEMFGTYGIHATWAAVGFLFADSRQALQPHLPPRELQPGYTDPIHSSYRLLDRIGVDPDEDQRYLCPELLDRIRQTPGQFIGSHTFSHYYCTEPGQTKAQFEADMKGAVSIAARTGDTLRSVVFPKNQVQKDYLPVCKSLGFTIYRGIEENWIYDRTKGMLLKLLRFADTYIPLSGNNIYLPERVGGILNIRGSRFLRPWHPRLRLLEGLKLRRIKGQMRAAAKEGKIFHLWWHPHNFGANMEENFENLRKILEYYLELKERYGFTSLSMEEIAQLYGEE